jgi:hypothetical protein
MLLRLPLGKYLVAPKAAGKMCAHRFPCSRGITGPQSLVYFAMLFLDTPQIVALLIGRGERKTDALAWNEMTAEEFKQLHESRVA